MRRLVVAAAILACTLLPSRATAQITTWSIAKDTSTHSLAFDTRLALFGAFALPVGDFGDVSYSNASFARPGAGFGLDFSVRFSNHVETGATVLVDWNRTDSGKLSAAYIAFLEHYGFPSHPLVLSATSWRTSWALVKLGYAPKVNPRLQVSADLYAGVLHAEYPEFSVVARPPNVSIRPNPLSPWVELGAGVGAGLRWRDHLSFGCLLLSDHPLSIWGSAPTQNPPVSVMHVTLGYSFGH